MEDLLISGLGTNHYSYARITTGDKEGEDVPRGEKLLLQQQAINFFNDKDIPFDSKDIQYVTKKMPQKENKRSTIVIKFMNRKYKKRKN